MLKKYLKGVAQVRSQIKSDLKERTFDLLNSSPSNLSGMKPKSSKTFNFNL